jgi:hypothetical protein
MGRDTRLQYADSMATPQDEDEMKNVLEQAPIVIGRAEFRVLVA